MKQVSEQLAELLRWYYICKAEYLKRFPRCRASLVGCKRIATQIHHKRGRGIYLCDVTTFLGVCWSCHMRIEARPARSRELGFTEDRLTTEDDKDLISWEQA